MLLFVLSCRIKKKWGLLNIALNLLKIAPVDILVPVILKSGHRAVHKKTTKKKEGIAFSEADLVTVYKCKKTAIE